MARRWASRKVKGKEVKLSLTRRRVKFMVFVRFNLVVPVQRPLSAMVKSNAPAQMVSLKKMVNVWM